QGAYLEWVKSTPGALNKLPEHLANLKKKKLPQDQFMVTEHFSRAPPMGHVIPYSDELFQQAAIVWLIATNQLIQALEHLKFKELINIASRGKNGIK
ncbi:hypothetical protein M422DRAFT_77883, partial [Sphaerobolus stellatus SS14]